jgi:hypothetical protein
MNALIQAIKGNGIYSGCAVTQTVVPDLYVNIAAGHVLFNSIEGEPVASVAKLCIHDDTYPRKAIITVDAAGVVTITHGVAAIAEPVGSVGSDTSSPAPPDIPVDEILIAEIWIEAGATAIHTADITDKRVQSYNFLGFHLTQTPHAGADHGFLCFRGGSGEGTTDGAVLFLMGQDFGAYHGDVKLYTINAAHNAAVKAFEVTHGDAVAGVSPVVNIPGSLTIAGLPVTGGLIWSEVNGATAGVVGNGYICYHVLNRVVVTLPSVAAVNSQPIACQGKGAAGWRIKANAGETIKFGNQTTSDGGYIESTLQYDAIEVKCIEADTTWVVRSSIGNLTVV